MRFRVLASRSKTAVFWRRYTTDIWIFGEPICPQRLLQKMTHFFPFVDATVRSGWLKFGTFDKTPFLTLFTTTICPKSAIFKNVTLWPFFTLFLTFSTTYICIFLVRFFSVTIFSSFFARFLFPLFSHSNLVQDRDKSRSAIRCAGGPNPEIFSPPQAGGFSYQSR